jgi:hypothetical protein
MDGPGTGSGRRLDSWKDIADYLGRGLATVRRWEKTLGLPVRRLPGSRGSSVFAFTDEIDAWLKSTPATETDSSFPAPSPEPPRRLGGWIAAGVAVAALGTFMAWRLAAHHSSLDDLRIMVTSADVVARDPDGRERWRYRFPPEFAWALSTNDAKEPWQVVTGDPPAIYVAAHARQRRSNRAGESGMLMALTPDGVLQRSFSFADEVRFHGVDYRAPWSITSFAVRDPGGPRRIAVAAHHAVWGASLLTVLDDQMRRHGTFVHYGWIEAVRWVSQDRLLIAGFSNAHDGGMVALIDVTALEKEDAQGPEAAGTEGHCQNCGSGKPVRMAILPRSMLNRATGAPFNRAVVEIAGDRILVRTIEVPSEGITTSVEAIYTFTASLDPVAGSYGDRYRDLRRSLVAQGRIKASSNDDRPREIELWEPAHGWRRVAIP